MGGGCAERLDKIGSSGTFQSCALPAGKKRDRRAIGGHEIGALIGDAEAGIITTLHEMIKVEGEKTESALRPCPPHHGIYRLFQVCEIDRLPVDPRKRRMGDGTHVNLEEQVGGAPETRHFLHPRKHPKLFQRPFLDSLKRHPSRNCRQFW